MNKNILFFNATYIKKILTLETAKKLGLTVTVIGPELPEWSIPYVDHYIYANTYNYDETISILRKNYSEIPFDGVITFWDRDVVPVAITAQEFNLKGSPVEAANCARNKWKMRECFKALNVPHPKFQKFSTWDELNSASNYMEYPLIIKPVGASASKGIFKISDPKNLYNTFLQFKDSTKPENDRMFSFYLNEYIVEEFMDGKEVSIEGIISDGKIFFAGITEKWTNDFFEEYQHAFPARLEDSIKHELLRITSEGIHALGLDNCGFHAEVMITDKGYKIVEINGRLGGDFITTHLIPLAKGIDITSANILAILGEKFNFENTKSKGACVRFLIANQAGIVKDWIGIEEVKKMQGVVDFVIEKLPGDYIELPPNKFHDSRIAYVITEGEDTDEAIELAECAISKVRCLITDPDRINIKIN